MNKGPFTCSAATWAKTKDSGDTAMAFAVDICMKVPLYEINKRLWFGGHFEGGDVFQDNISFYLRQTADRTTVRYGLGSTSGAGTAKTLLEPEDFGDGRLHFNLPLGFKKDAANKPKPGFRGRLQVTATPWNREEDTALPSPVVAGAS